MSLKELRTLAPFFWDSKASKHPVGAKGRRDFEEVRRGRKVFEEEGGAMNAPPSARERQMPRHSNPHTPL
jgi:hypothetical protein